MHLLAFLFIIFAFLMLGTRGLRISIALMGLQAFILTAIAFVLAYQHAMEIHLLIIGGLTFIIKSIVLPIVLLRLRDITETGEKIKLSFSIVSSVAVGLLLIALSYFYVVPVMLHGIATEGKLLEAAIAGILVGCFFMISRRSVITQIIGIVVMENGIFLTGMAITGGMPLLVELGIFFDVLVGALVMGVITYRISDRFDTLDVENLNSLKG